MQSLLKKSVSMSVRKRPNIVNALNAEAKIRFSVPLFSACAFAVRIDMDFGIPAVLII